MPIVPNTHTNTKIHRKRRSITMATYFQSSLTCGWGGTKRVRGWGEEKDYGEHNHTLSHILSFSSSAFPYVGWGLMEVKG